MTFHLFEERSGKAVHGSQRGAQIVSDSVTKRLHHFETFAQFRGADLDGLLEQLGMVPELCLGLFEALLSAFALGDIHERGNDFMDRSVLVEQGNGIAIYPKG